MRRCPRRGDPGGARGGRAGAGVCGRELALFAYALRLTTEPATLTKAHIRALRHAGLDDGQILEANQVIAYFAYANRTVLGLGVTTQGEILGRSPFDQGDPDDRGHG